MSFWLDEARRGADASLNPHDAGHVRFAEWVLGLARSHDDLIEEHRRLEREWRGIDLTKLFKRRGR